MTPEREAKILELIRLGLTYEKACQAAGIDKGTLWRWMKIGKAAKSGKFYDFRVAIDRARAEGEEKHVQNIVNAGTSTWQASAWWLERTNRERWGKEVKINIDYTQLSDEDLERILAGEHPASVVAG